MCELAFISHPGGSTQQHTPVYNNFIIYLIPNSQHFYLKIIVFPLFKNVLRLLPAFRRAQKIHLMIIGDLVKKCAPFRVYIYGKKKRFLSKYFIVFRIFKVNGAHSVSHNDTKLLFRHVCVCVHFILVIPNIYFSHLCVKHPSVCAAAASSCNSLTPCPHLLLPPFPRGFPFSRLLL